MTSQKKELIEKVFQAISNGAIVVEGNKLLPERELCEYFKVGRGPLRDVMIIMEALDIVDIRERQGMFLSDNGINGLANSLESLSLHSPIEVMNHSFEFRIIIEPEAARLAAQRRSERHVQMLLQEIALLDGFNSSQQERSAELRSLHSGIVHQIVIDASGNQVIREIYKGVSALNDQSFANLGNSVIQFRPYEAWPDVLFAEHNAVVQAIVHRDEDLAYETMKTHLRQSYKRNNEILSQNLPIISFPE